MYPDPSTFGDNGVDDIGSVCSVRTAHVNARRDDARLAGRVGRRTGRAVICGGMDQSLWGLAGLAADTADAGLAADTGLAGLTADAADAGLAGLAADAADAGLAGLSIEVGGAGCAVVSGATVAGGDWGLCGDGGLSTASSFPG